MKKILMSTAVLALTLASCSQNEVIDTPQGASDQAINFGVYTTQTKGLVLNGDVDNSSDGTVGIKTSRFGILAAYTGQEKFEDLNKETDNGKKPTMNFMWNQEVKYTSNAWTYTPLKYWPNTKDDKISFFAYAPYATGNNNDYIKVSGNGAKGSPTITYNLIGKVKTGDVTTQGNGANIVNSPDLVVDSVPDQTKITTKIPFQFKHILSRVKMSARVNHDLTTAGIGTTNVYITDVTILNEASNKFAIQGTYDFGTRVWTNIAEADTLNLKALIPFAKVTGSTINGGDYTTDVHPLLNNGNEKSLFNENQYLFALPVNSTEEYPEGGINASTDVVVSISYDVITEDNALTGKYSITPTTAKVSLPDGTLQKGKAYNYIFTIGLEGIEVDAQVVAWGQDKLVNDDDDDDELGEKEDEIYAPSATSGDATSDNLLVAIQAMNAAKKSTDSNSNYFIIKVGADIAADVTFTNTDHVAFFNNFVIGDIIEFNFGETTPSGSYTINARGLGWETTKSSKSIFLKKVSDSALPDLPTEEEGN